MQNITVAGRIGADAVTRSTNSGDKVTSFNVAVDFRDGRDKATNWWRVSFWGKRGDALQPYLLKGTSVTVTGEFSLSEYEGKPQLNIRANDVTLQGSRGEGRGNGGNTAPRDESRAAGGFDDGLDGDEIPFIRMDGML
jgi:single-strand DNA-binding protein